MAFDNPKFFLSVETQGGRGGQAEVNGFPVFENFARVTGRATFPVTHLVAPGANTIRWLVYLEEDEIEDVAHVGAALIARSRSAPGTPEVAVARVALTGSVLDRTSEEENGEAEAADENAVARIGRQQVTIDAEAGTIAVSREVELLVPHREWAWVESEPIPDTAATRDSLIEWYKRFIEVLDAREAEKATAILSEKTREIAVAFDLTEEEALGEFGLVRTSGLPNWKRVETDWDAVIVQFAMDNRLVRLLGPPYGDVLAYEEEDLFTAFSLWLRRKDGRWIVSR